MTYVTCRGCVSSGCVGSGECANTGIKLVKVPAFEQQQASAEVPETVTVPLSDWLAMFRRLGMAEGLLAGWLYAGRDTARAKAATEAFLANRSVTVEGAE